MERGAVSISEGDRDGAIEDLRAALKLEPSQSDAQRRLEALEAGPAWEPESESAQEAEIPETEGSIVTRTMGDLYARQGFRDQAIGVYERLLKADPGNAELEARLEELRAPPALVEPEAEEDEESSSWIASHAAGDLESRTEEVGEPSDVSTLHATADPAVGARPISQYFEDLLAWVPGAVPVETLAPTSGQIEGQGPAPEESAAREKSAEVKPSGAESATAPERARESDEPTEEGLDDFNVWLKSLQP